MTNQRAVIVGGIRIPFTKSWGVYRDQSLLDLLIAASTALVEKYSLKGKVLGDAAMGAVLKHPRDYNLCREAVLGSGLDAHTPGVDVQRACGTSLEATIMIANKIQLGQIEVGIAGGCDSNSDLPMMLKKKASDFMVNFNFAKTPLEKLKTFGDFRPEFLMPEAPNVNEPRTRLRMGDHCELMAKEWKLTQKEQDEWALKSHQDADKAYKEGFYNDLVCEFRGLKKDSFIRGDTSLEKLSKLKPAFDREAGTLTAGNSTPLSDGAATVLLASEEYAKKNNLPIQAYFVDGQVAAVDFVAGEGLLMAPTYAVAQLLSRQGMRLQDFESYEIHEAFAAQVLCTLKAWESKSYCQNKLGLSEALGSIERSKINKKGGSVALGHPFGATGARLVATLAKELAGNSGARGLISVCTGGGMGVAAILESAA